MNLFYYVFVALGNETGASHSLVKHSTTEKNPALVLLSVVRQGLTLQASLELPLKHKQAPILRPSCLSYQTTM